MIKYLKHWINETSILDETSQNDSSHTIYSQLKSGDKGRINDILKELQLFQYFQSLTESKLMKMEEAILCNSKTMRIEGGGDPTPPFVTNLLKKKISTLKNELSVFYWERF